MALLPRARTAVMLARLALLCALQALTAPPLRAAEPGYIWVIAPSSAPFTDVGRRVTDELLKDGHQVHTIKAERVPMGAAPPDLVVTLGTTASTLIATNYSGTPRAQCLVQAIPSDAQATLTLMHNLGAQLDMLERVLPATETLGVLYTPENSADRVQALTVAAAARGISVAAQPVVDAAEIQRGLAALEPALADDGVLWSLPDGAVYSPRTARTLLLFSFRHRIPMVGLTPAWVESGALYALGWDYVDLGAQCAELARGVLENEPAMTASPRAMTFSVNRRTARQMRVVLPPTLLSEAEHVY